MNIGWTLIIVGVLLAAIAAFLIPYGFHLLSKPSPFLTGILETVIINPEEDFTVSVGSNLFITDYDSLINGFDMSEFIGYGHEYPVKIKVIEGKLLISAWIADEEGNMIAHIVDNNWEVNPNNFFDRNFSNSALEVIGKNRVPVLQVVIQSGNSVYIGGLFTFPGGRVFITPDDFFINPSDDTIKSKIERIFKYPGDKYLGQIEK